MKVVVISKLRLSCCCEVERTSLNCLNSFFDKLIVFHERVGIFLNVATCLEYCAEMRVRTPKLRKLFYF